MTDMLPLLPDLPDCVTGVVGNSPWTLQRHDCAATVTAADIGLKHDRIGILVMLSGYHFHGCERTDGVRRCPACLAAVKAACTLRDHRRDR